MTKCIYPEKQCDMNNEDECLASDEYECPGEYVELRKECKDGKDGKEKTIYS